MHRKPADSLCKICAVCTSAMPSINAGKQAGRYLCAPSPQCSTASSNTHTAFHLSKGIRYGAEGSVVNSYERDGNRAQTKKRLVRIFDRNVCMLESISRRVVRACPMAEFCCGDAHLSDEGCEVSSKGPNTGAVTVSKTLR